MYIDTHCHLNLPDFDADLTAVIGTAKKAGVKKFIIPGVDCFFSEKAINIARVQPGTLFAGIGFHPYESNRYPDVNDLEIVLKKYLIPTGQPKERLQIPTIIAIGECGLDYHLYKGENAHGKKDQQKHVFEDQLLLAIKYDLPAIIHCRSAFTDLFSVLDALPQTPRGVIHCFSGGLQDLRMCLERKLYVGIDGNSTYSKHIQSVIPEIPLENMLLETDSPYLTPAPHRGKRNEPKYIPLVAKMISSLIKRPVSVIENQTTINAQNLFHINT